MSLQKTEKENRTITALLQLSYDFANAVNGFNGCIAISGL
jgi:hypothetical protein